jgi:hypothetical protein
MLESVWHTPNRLSQQYSRWLSSWEIQKVDGYEFSIQTIFLSYREIVLNGNLALLQSIPL